MIQNVGLGDIHDIINRARLHPIFVPGTHLRFICRSFVAPNITLFTDYRLAVCELIFRPRITNRNRPQPPPVDNLALSDQDVRIAFQTDISNRDPELLSSEELSNSIRTVAVSAANKVLPRKSKSKFPVEFSAQTIYLVHQKRKLWKFLQKSGKRITRSMREEYRNIRRDTKN